MKDNPKTYQKLRKNNNQKKRENNNENKWRLSMKEVLRGACLINGDGP